MICIISRHESPTRSARQRQPAARFPMRGRARTAFFFLLLVFIAGCAVTPKVQDDRRAVEPVVSGPDKGSEGFEIVERIETDGESRRDFESAVDCMEGGGYDEAIALLDRLIARAPGLTAPHVNIALAYEQKGETEKAEEHLKTALNLSPGHPVASNAYGLLLRKNGRFSEAREIFELALDRFPDYLPARKNLGILCELYLGDTACALEQFERYHEGAPDDEQVMIWIASLRQRIVSSE